MPGPSQLLLDDNEIATLNSTPAPSATPTDAPNGFTDLGVIGLKPDKFSAETAPAIRQGLDVLGATGPVGALASAGGRLLLDDDEIAYTPYEDPSLYKSASRVGNGTDGRPVLNLQAVRMPLRTVAQLLFDDPREKKAFLEKQLGPEWIVGKYPGEESGNFAIRKKGSPYWGVLDVSRDGGFKELIQDAKENVDTIAQILAVPSGILTGALASGGIQATRQAVKKLLDPDASFDLARTGLDTGAGAIPGFIGGGLKTGFREAKNVAEKGLESGKAIVARGEGSSMWQKVKDIPSKLDSPEWQLREFGGTAEQFNNFQKKSLTDNIDYLQKASPEYNQARKAITLKGKYQNMNDLLSKTGQEIGDAFNDPNKVVAISDILDTEAYQGLKNAATTRVIQKGQGKLRVNAKVQKKIDATQRDMLEQLATLVLPEGPSTNNVLNLFRKGELGSSDIAKQMGAKTNNEAMEMLLRGKDIPMSDAWLMKMGNNELLKYGRKKEVIDSLSTARKFVPDSIKDALQTALYKEMGPQAADIIDKVELYHQLLPVVATLSKKVAANKAEQFNPLKTVPGWMLSTPRFAMALGRNLLQKPEITSLIRSGSLKLPLPEGSNYLSQSGAAGVMGHVAKGMQYMSAEAFGQHNLLPRSAEPYFQDPAAFDALITAVGDDETTDAMTRAIERGDKETFTQLLGRKAAEHEPQFARAQVKSAVQDENGDTIITDMYDRAQLRESLKRIEDPVERYNSLRALNMSNKLLNPKDVPQPKATPSVDPKGTSPVSRVASTLRKANMVDIGNGETRRDYDY